MRTASSILLLLAAGLAAFAWWGLFTAAGRHAYDEMAGIVPHAAGVLSAILAVCPFVARWLRVSAPVDRSKLLPPSFAGRLVPGREATCSGA